MPNQRTDSPRLGRAAAVLLTLGLFSAAALLAASLTDFGDPRVEARAQASQGAATQAREIQVHWDELRHAAGSLPGTLRTFRIADDQSLTTSTRDRAQRARDERDVDPLLVALEASGRSAMHRGDPASALGALTRALQEARPNARGTERVLFEALRAAGAIDDATAVELYRTELLGHPHDALVEATSARLLATLVEPADPAAGFELLTAATVTLPRPVDRAHVTGGHVTFTLDPWWKALRSAFTSAAPDRDWNSAFQVDLRKALAIERELNVPRSSWQAHWTVVQRGEGRLAARRSNGAFELAVMDESALFAALTASEDEAMRVQIAVAQIPFEQIPVEQGSGLDRRPLAGSPYSVAVQPIDPEAAARPQLRRIRWIRGGLVGLSALVLLASLLSARAATRARRLARLRSTFVASVSHDLRTPTQAILLLAESLEDGAVDSTEARGRYHTQIRREAQRLRRLIEDLLDGARIDRGGGARVERRLVRTEPFFTELSRAMQDRAAAAGAELRVTVASLPEAIHVDPDGVHRAIWNLFENALAHGRSADAGERPKAAVDVQIRMEDGALCCVVADDGPGIPARHAESVFAPFERLIDRASNAGIDRDTGTGLGLSIVRAIAEGHGGAARVEPSPRGARFVVTFRAEMSEGEAA